MRAQALATIIARVPRIWPLVALYACVVGTFALSNMSVEPYDDGHFFKRIALNALETGELAWNLDEGPVYGSTSQLFQALAVGVTSLTDDYYMLAMRVLAALSLVGAFALLVHLSRMLDRGLCAAAAFVSPVVLTPVLTGMETALAFVLIAGVLWLVFSERGRHAHFAVAPLAVTLLYLTRPDATLLALGPIAAMRWLPDRKRAFYEGVLLVLLLSACLLALKLYYGTALPLPFYAKNAAFSPYDPHFIEISSHARNVRFGLFAAFGVPLLVLALAARDRAGLALVGSVVLFSAYHGFATIDVMGMRGRFYAPALPVLAFAAARGVAAMRAGSRLAGADVVTASLAAFGLLALVGFLPGATGFRLERVELVFYTVIAPAIVLACACAKRQAWHARAAAALLLVSLVTHASRVSSASFRVYDDDDYLALHTKRYTVYRGLDTLRACFGEHLHVYHSEVGLPGLRFQHGKVSDLAGLLSKHWLFEGKGKVDAFCLRDRPEAVFLPHENYRDLNRNLLEGQCLHGYQRMVKESRSPLYVRNDIAKRYLHCAKQRKDPFVKGTVHD